MKCSAADVWDHFELPVLDKDGNKRVRCTRCREGLTVRMISLSFKCLFTFLRAFDFDKIFRYQHQHLVICK